MTRTSPLGAHARARTIGAACGTLLLGLTVAVPMAHAADKPDPLKSKQSKVQKGIKGAQSDLDESSRALASARTRLTTARTKLAAAERTLAGTRAKLVAAEARDAAVAAQLARAQAALVAAQAKFEAAKAHVIEQRRSIGVLVAQNYQYGDPQLMGLVAVLKAGDPTEVTTQLNTVRSMMGRQANTLDDLKGAEARMRSQKQRMQELEAVVAARRDRAAQYLETKQAIEQEAANARHDIAVLVGDRAAAEDSAARIKSADLRRLKNLQAEESRIKAQILARAAKQKGGFVGDSNGFLLRPVDGPITSPYGWRIHPIYGYWGLHNGADFHAPCGTPLRSAGNGTVVQKYFSDVWGNRLLVDLGRVNGKNVTVIYNHLSGYAVGVGDHVTRGETVGYSGDTGWSTACHLHFTVMVNGETTDPAPWF